MPAPAHAPLGKICASARTAPTLGPILETGQRRALLGWNHTNDTAAGIRDGKIWCWVASPTPENGRIGQEKLQCFDLAINRVPWGIRGEWERVDCGVANFAMVRMFHPYWCPDGKIPQDGESNDKGRCRKLYHELIDDSFRNVASANNEERQAIKLTKKGIDRNAGRDKAWKRAMTKRRHGTVWKEMEQKKQEWEGIFGAVEVPDGDGGELEDDGLGLAEYQDQGEAVSEGAGEITVEIPASRPTEEDATTATPSPVSQKDREQNTVWGTTERPMVSDDGHDGAQESSGGKKRKRSVMEEDDDQEGDSDVHVKHEPLEAAAKEFAQLDNRGDPISLG